MRSGCVEVEVPLPAELQHALQSLRPADEAHALRRIAVGESFCGEAQRVESVKSPKGPKGQRRCFLLKAPQLLALASQEAMDALDSRTDSAGLKEVLCWTA